jgi:hypothetical protein
MITSKIYYRMSLGTHNSLCQNFSQSHCLPCDPSAAITDDTEIVTYIEGREDTHFALEDNPAVHVMSLILAGTTLCSACQAALNGRGITSTDTMYTAGTKLAAILPTLRPSRF